MANCSENNRNSPIVDANYGFAPDITNACEELTIDRALKNIFMACDKDNTGYALVSDLICFITPHLQSHLPKLMVLKQTLDPDDADPMVDHETFCSVMNEWTSKVLTESPELDCKRHGVNREPKKCVGETKLGFSLRSPPPSLSGDGVTENSDSPLECNVYGSNFSISSESDIVTMQEHTKQLEHQNRKLTEELENTRSQLSVAEEQNETFQADLERISRRLISEQQLNGQLEKDRQATAELLETSNAAQKLIGKLEKDLTSSEKQLLQLKEANKKFEEQNQKLEDRIDQITQKETAAKQQIAELKNEINTKEQEILSLEEINTQLKNNLETQQKEITECNDINIALKAEKEKLEQCLRNSFRNQSLPHALKPSNSFTEYPTTASSERTETALVPKGTDALSTSDNTSINNVLDNSSEDDLYWKLQMVNYSPHESLEAEMSQAENKEVKEEMPINSTFIINEQQKNIHHLESVNDEIRKTIENLINENSKLKIQIALNKEKQKCKLVSNELTDRIENETDIKALETKLEELEKDNNVKYIKIIDLIEEKESLENQLKINNFNKEELANLQMRFSELQHQKQELLEALENIKWEKHDSDVITKHLQSVKNECEVLQNQLKCFRQAELEKNVEFEKISNENDELKTNINNLVKTISQLNDENSGLSNMVETLRSSLKGKEEIESNRSVIENKYKQMEENICIQTEELKTLKDTIAQQQKTIESLNQRITELTITNTKVMENLSEKECQTDILKQIINHQNESLKTLEDEKELVLNKLTEQGSLCNGLVEENKELMEKLECALAKFNIEQERKEKIMDNNIELTEKLEAVSSQLYNEKCENQKIVDNNMKIVEEFQNTIKELQKQNGKLREKVKRLKTIQEQCEKLKKDNSELKEKLNTMETSQEKYEEKNVEDEKELEKKIECIIKEIDEQQNDKELIEKLQNTTAELGEYQCQIERLLNTNKELNEKLETKEKEIEILNFQLNNLKASSERVKAEFDIVIYDYKNIKDANNNIKKENELLSNQKNVLVNKLEELANDYNEIRGLKESIDQELLQIKNETEQLRSENDTLKKSLSKSSTNLHTKQVEISNLLNEISQLKEELHNKLTKDVCLIQDKINSLENKNKNLQSENDKLQGNFESVRSNFEKLADEKEEWLSEKANWQQIVDECSKKLSIVKDKEQLLLERLNKNVCDENDCSSCVILKKEVEQLNLQLKEFRCKIRSYELDDKGGYRSTNRSYDKLQIKIEKLKSKLFTVEEQSRLQKQKISSLELKHSNLKMESEESLKQFNEERLNLHTTISSLEDILKIKEDNYLKMQENKSETEHEKEGLLKNIQELQQRLEATTTKKEKCWKALNHENQQLRLEIEEINKVKVNIEKKLERVQAALKNKAQLKQEIDELSNQKSKVEGKLEKIELDIKKKIISEQKIKCEFETISKENGKLKNEIKELNEQKADLAKAFEKYQIDLQKSEKKRIAIRKEFIDLQLLHENKDLENRNCKDLITERNDLQKQLKDCENELINSKIRLCDSCNYITILSEYVKNVNEKLSEKRHRLSRSTLTVVSSWRDTFESTPETKQVLEAFNKGDEEEFFGNVTGPLDEEMFKFRHQIQISCMVLDSFASLRLPVLQKHIQNTEIQESSENELSSLLRQKFIKKFTLKANNSAPSTTSDNPTIPIEPLNQKRIESDDISSNENGVLQESLMHKNFDEVEGFSAIDKEVQKGLLTDKLALEMVSPSFSDNTLENLGLLHEGESPRLTPKEMEEKFTLLVASFMIDIKTIKDRHQNQEIRQKEMKELCSQELRKLLVVLMNVYMAARDCHIKQLIKMSTNQILAIVSTLSQTSELATQCGALLQEQRFLKVMNFMINYAANLTRSAENTAHQFKFISPPRSCFRSNSYDRSSNSDSSSGASSGSLQSKEISSVCFLNENNQSENFILQAENVQLLPNDFFEPVSNTIVQETSESQRRHNLRIGRFGNTVYNTFLFYLFFLTTVILIIIMLDLNFISIHGYPWRWVSWDDIFSPLIQRIYFRGLPPT